MKSSVYCLLDHTSGHAFEKDWETGHIKLQGNIELVNIKHSSYFCARDANQ